LTLENEITTKVEETSVEIVETISIHKINAFATNIKANELLVDDFVDTSDHVSSTSMVYLESINDTPTKSSDTILTSSLDQSSCMIVTATPLDTQSIILDMLEEMVGKIIANIGLPLTRTDHDNVADTWNIIIDDKFNSRIHYEALDLFEQSSAITELPIMTEYTEKALLADDSTEINRAVEETMQHIVDSMSALEVAVLDLSALTELHVHEPLVSVVSDELDNGWRNALHWEGDDHEVCLELNGNDMASGYDRSSTTVVANTLFEDRSVIADLMEEIISAVNDISLVEKVDLIEDGSESAKIIYDRADELQPSDQAKTMSKFTEVINATFETEHFLQMHNSTDLGFNESPQYGKAHPHYDSEIPFLTLENEITTKVEETSVEIVETISIHKINAFATNIKANELLVDDFVDTSDHVSSTSMVYLESINDTPAKSSDTILTSSLDLSNCMMLVSAFAELPIMTEYTEEAFPTDGSTEIKRAVEETLQHIVDSMSAPKVTVLDFSVQTELHVHEPLSFEFDHDSSNALHKENDDKVRLERDMASGFDLPYRTVVADTLFEDRSIIADLMEEIINATNDISLDDEVNHVEDDQAETISKFTEFNSEIMHSMSTQNFSASFNDSPQNGEAHPLKVSEISLSRTMITSVEKEDNEISCTAEETLTGIVETNVNANELLIDDFIHSDQSKSRVSDEFSVLTDLSKISDEVETAFLVDENVLITRAVEETLLHLVNSISALELSALDSNGSTEIMDFLDTIDTSAQSEGISNVNSSHMDASSFDQSDHVVEDIESVYVETCSLILVEMVDKVLIRLLYGLNEIGSDEDFSHSEQWQRVDDGSVGQLPIQRYNNESTEFPVQLSENLYQDTAIAELLRAYDKVIHVQTASLLDIMDSIPPLEVAALGVSGLNDLISNDDIHLASDAKTASSGDPSATFDAVAEMIDEVITIIETSRAQSVRVNSEFNFDNNSLESLKQNPEIVPTTTENALSLDDGINYAVEPMLLKSTASEIDGTGIDFVRESNNCSENTIKDLPMSSNTIGTVFVSAFEESDCVIVDDPPTVYHSTIIDVVVDRIDEVSLTHSKSPSDPHEAPGDKWLHTETVEVASDTSKIDSSNTSMQNPSQNECVVIVNFVEQEYETTDDCKELPCNFHADESTLIIYGTVSNDFSIDNVHSTEGVAPEKISDLMDTSVLDVLSMSTSAEISEECSSPVRPYDVFDTDDSDLDDTYFAIVAPDSGSKYIHNLLPSIDENDDFATDTDTQLDLRENKASNIHDDVKGNDLPKVRSNSEYLPPFGHKSSNVLENTEFNNSDDTSIASAVFHDGKNGKGLNTIKAPQGEATKMNRPDDERALEISLLDSNSQHDSLEMSDGYYSADGEISVDVQDDGDDDCTLNADLAEVMSSMKPPSDESSSEYSADVEHLKVALPKKGGSDDNQSSDSDGLWGSRLDELERPASLSSSDMEVPIEMQLSGDIFVKSDDFEAVTQEALRSPFAYLRTTSSDDRMMDGMTIELFYPSTSKSADSASSSVNGADSKEKETAPFSPSASPASPAGLNNDSLIDAVCCSSFGDVYEGHVNQNGDFHGIGRIQYRNGDRYEGGFFRNLKSGRGMYYYANGDQYCGEYKYGRKEGIGFYMYFSGESFEGHYRNDVRHGRGIYRYNNGDQYEGDYCQGKKSGKGIYRFSDGMVYEGEVQNGKPCGAGVWSYANGDMFQCVVNHTPHGL